MKENGFATVEILKKELQSGPVRIRIMTGSMEPVLKVDRLYFLQACQSKKLSRFDIVVFWNGEVLVAHYVWHINIAVDTGTIITRSLRPFNEDLPLRRDQILGWVTGVKIPPLIRFKILLSAFAGFAR